MNDKIFISIFFFIPFLFWLAFFAVLRCRFVQNKPHVLKSERRKKSILKNHNMQEMINSLCEFALCVTLYIYFDNTFGKCEKKSDVERIPRNYCVFYMFAINVIGQQQIPSDSDRLLRIFRLEYQMTVCRFQRIEIFYLMGG